MLRTPRVSIPLLCALCLLAATPGSANEVLDRFRKAWTAAGGDTDLQVAAVRGLGAENVPEAVEPLVALAADVEVALEVAEAAHQALAGLGSEAAVARLGELAGKSSVPIDRRIECARALSASVHPGRMAPLLGLLGEDDWRVRSWAIRGLGSVRVVEVVERLIERLAKEEGRLAGEVADALFRLTGEEIREVEDWRTWWSAHREGYEFPGPSEAVTETRVRLGRTRVQGSGVFETVASKRVVFVVDTSYSMNVRADPPEGEPGTGKTRLEHVKRELVPLLEAALPPGSRFNLVTFGTEVLTLKKRMEKSSSSAVGQAVRFVKGLEPMGETNIMGALDAAFADREVDTIYFLSDGFPTKGRTTDIQQILREVRRMNRGRGVTIHTIAFLAGDGLAQGVVESKDVCTAFLRDLARVGHGRIRIVE